MHDAKGLELKVGDTVVVPCIITQCGGDENFCCLNIKTVGVMPGNLCHNEFSALSTKQVYRFNKSDSALKSIDTVNKDGIVFLI